MPDFRVNYTATSEDNGVAKGTVSLAGAHTGKLIPPFPGLPQVPATGKHIALPKEPVQVTARGAKLTNWHVDNVPNGGFLGIMAQMGVALPAH